MCSLGCQVRLLTKNGRVIGSLPDHQAGAESLCVKGRFGFPELLNHPTRLTHPQKAVEGNRRLNITWEEIIRLAAEKLSTTAPQGGFEMLVSPNCSLESLYVAQKFTRQGMKSNAIHTNHINGYAQDKGALFDLARQSQPLSILASAATILCLGLDDKYSQSVVEVMLHRSKGNGARIIAALCSSDSVAPFADLWLKPAAENEAGLVLEQAARVLHNSTPGSPVILVGPGIFSQPDRRALLPAIVALVQASQARVIVIPDQASLLDLLLDIPGRDNQLPPTQTQVLYLIGENIAELPSTEKPFILYQNIYPPADGLEPDLILPTTPFSEEDGSLIDYAGRVRNLRRSVPPPGLALPAWEILCRIAQKMGLPGFDFSSVLEIQAEMANLPGNFLANGQVDWAAVSAPAMDEPVRQSPDLPQPAPDTYLGFPLTHSVQGLNQLYPEKGRQKHG